MNQRLAYVYGLVDPLTDEVRYVGVTAHPKPRVKDHFRRPLPSIRDWLRGLPVEPKLQVLDRVPWRHRFEAERTWIREYSATVLNQNAHSTGGPLHHPISQ